MGQDRGDVEPARGGAAGCIAAGPRATWSRPATRASRTAIRQRTSAPSAAATSVTSAIAGRASGYSGPASADSPIRW